MSDPQPSGVTVRETRSAHKPTKAKRSPARLPEQRWQIAPSQREVAEQIAQATSLSPLITQILLNRGYSTLEEVQAFLEPETLELPDPLEAFPDLPLSLELLQEAIVGQQKIAICGDYDADGMTSTALLLRALRSLGAQVDYAIPSRMQEGYGINRRIIEEFHDEGVGLILTVDNGIAAVEPIALARELGLEVIITDHHDLPPELPPASAILNPKLIDESSPYRGLAGVGVAYVLAVSLAQQMQREAVLADALLELFTLGTIADLAPLTGVNRRWVKRGLRLLPRTRVPGVQALIQMTGLSHKQALQPEAIGFSLGPRINAVGRLADPQIVIELLTTDNIAVALERAMQCEQINQERQKLCQEIEREAIALFEESEIDLLKDRVLVLVKAGWHHGVIGIVASRLVERYGVPVFIGTYEDDAEQHIRGSARSIPEFHVFEALESCREVLGKFGGHKAAGGFSLPGANLAEFKRRLSLYAHTCLQLEHLKPLLQIDVQANFDQLHFGLLDQLDALHPCGIENPEPIFWTRNVQVVEQKAIGKGRAHLKVHLAQVNAVGEQNRFAALAWRWGEFCPVPSVVDVAYKLRINEWNGDQTLELELVGIRPTTAEPDSLPKSKIEFEYNQRQYSCGLFVQEDGLELRIRNADGKVLAVQPGQSIGLLGMNRQEAIEVNVMQPHFTQLIQSALAALGVDLKDLESAYSKKG